MIGASQRWRSPWVPLAWFAALLLALAPTISRLAAESGEDVALCTASGLRYVPIAGAPSAGEPSHHGDCAYCPLLASADLAAGTVPFLPLAFPALPPPTSFAVTAPAARRWPAPLARGPPARD